MLIADGNYPFSTGSAPHARRVYLNLSPGMVKVTDVLAVLVDAIPIEGAQVMVPRSGPPEVPPDEPPPIFEEFHEMLPTGVVLEPLERFAFYAAAKEDSVALVIATGEERIYANILLTIGVVI